MRKTKEKPRKRVTTNSHLQVIAADSLNFKTRSFWIAFCELIDFGVGGGGQGGRSCVCVQSKMADPHIGVRIVSHEAPQVPHI